jgi:uncharacterized membrane protein YcfT
MTSIADVLSDIEHLSLSQALAKSDHLVGAGLQVLHIAGFVMLLAGVLFISLRLLGWVLPEQPLPLLSRSILRLVSAGLVLALASGIGMFIASPQLYFYKPVFQFKLVLFVAAVAVHLLLLRRVARQPAPRPVLARASVALSLLAWFGIGMAGRMIGFV